MPRAGAQGAGWAKTAPAFSLRAPERFKLFTEGTDLVKILEGHGHFKWKKGETDFAPGDCFEAENPGEYEVNGSGKFLVVRK